MMMEKKGDADTTHTSSISSCAVSLQRMSTAAAAATTARDCL
jgi:hypothetical protein